MEIVRDRYAIMRNGRREIAVETNGSSYLKFKPVADLGNARIKTFSSPNKISLIEKDNEIVAITESIKIKD